MQIEHSALLNEFVSFWFETIVDGEHRYDTFLSFVSSEWCTCQAFAKPILLRGRLDPVQAEEEMMDAIKPLVEAAIRTGQI